MKILLLILWCVASYVVSGFIHECGHLVVGLLKGFKFYMFVIGPFGVKTDNEGKKRFYFENRVELWPGCVGTRPCNLENIDSALDAFSSILLGGPLSSIIIGVVALIFGISIHSFLLIAFGAITLGMGMACLIPIRMGAFYSDGGRWLRIKKKETRKIEKALFRIEFSSEDDTYANANMQDILTLINCEEPVRLKAVQS